MPTTRGMATPIAHARASGHPRGNARALRLLPDGSPLSRAGAGFSLFRLFQIIVGPYEVLACLRQVAVKARARPDLVVPSVILGEDAILPLAIFLVGRIFAAPALFLAHHGVLAQ